MTILQRLAATFETRSGRRVLVGALCGLLLGACNRPQPVPEPLRAVRVLTLGNDSAGATATYAAEVRARSESRLSFRVPGKVTQRQAELGQQVRAGQLLARLDPADLEQAKAAANAALVAAQAQLELARSDFGRFEDLHAQGFISAAELERRRVALQAARSQVEQARAQATVQSHQVQHAELRAPASGVVTAVEVEPGAVVAAGQTVLRLAYDGPRDAVFAVPEQRIDALRALIGVPGALQFRLWAGGPPLPAMLRELSAAADPTTRTYGAKADLGGARVLLGQTASVTLAGPRVEGVFRLPSTAVWQHQGRSAVYVVDRSDMTVRPVAVTVAGADGNLLVVAAGLKAGQEVVTAGVHALTPGQRICIFGATDATRPAATTPAQPAPASAPR